MNSEDDPNYENMNYIYELWVVYNINNQLLTLIYPFQILPGNFVFLI